MALINTIHGEVEESELLKLEGGFENDEEVVRWVQYHLPADGSMVHRSAHVHLKTVFADGAIATFG
jgi:hypothetical protein